MHSNTFTLSMFYRNKNNDKPQSTYQTPAGLQNLFGQVEQVKTTMVDNMEMMHERGNKLEQLDNTTREMMENAKELAQSGSGKKKK